MIDRYPYNPTAYDDDWEDQPAQGWFYKWVLGTALPIGLAIFSARAIFTHHVLLHGRDGSMQLYGRNAVGFGIAWLSAAVFVHCHYFWGNVYDQAWFAVLGKIISACGFIAGLAFVLIRVGVLGINT